MVKVFSPKIRGSQDQHVGDCVLVPLGSAHRSFPRVSGDVPPATYWRYSETARRVVSMVTVVDNGTHVAWDMCGGCMHTLRRCRCMDGFRAPDYIWNFAGGRPRKTAPVSLPPRLAMVRTDVPDQVTVDKAAERVASEEVKKLGARLTFRRKTDMETADARDRAKGKNGFKKMRRR